MIPTCRDAKAAIVCTACVENGSKSTVWRSAIIVACKVETYVCGSPAKSCGSAYTGPSVGTTKYVATPSTQSTATAVTYRAPASRSRVHTSATTRVTGTNTIHTT